MMDELGGERGRGGEARGYGSEMPAVAALYYTITVRKDYKSKLRHRYFPDPAFRLPI